MITYKTLCPMLVESFSQGTPAIGCDLGVLPELIDQLKARREKNQDAVA